MRRSLASLLLWGAGMMRSLACAEQCSYVTLYVSKPSCENPTVGVVYLTDVFGIQQAENRLLADSFARAGFLVVAPDMFNGTPAPLDFNTPGFNQTEFTLLHSPADTDPIIAKGIEYMKTTGVSKVAVTGYCFGDRYTFRFLAAGKGVDAGFAAHPALLEDSEVQAVTRPISVAFAENDTTLLPPRRSEIEALLLGTAQPYQTSLFGGASHGFGVRANNSVPEQKFSKEAAFYQAVRWFNAWAGGAL
ncbi:1d7c17ca-1cc0-4d42-b276-34afbfb10273 [Thermothielavioides terrestris]|uniref:1d7c17ca-1cc0-4d42-b276-34afbfb10273 n=1 Tax=Thermothielavioides terrestris TaxID=2587410 RepID=A0A3S4D984_9PEZI|nr:1d7c17ca-1cc0-4d42-b276-34afbfb10273 [Thermothielavioides terrestris]